MNEDLKEVWEALWEYDYESLKQMHSEYIKSSKVSFDEPDKNYIKANMIHELFPYIVKQMFNIEFSFKCNTKREKFEKC